MEDALDGPDGGEDVLEGWELVCCAEEELCCAGCWLDELVSVVDELVDAGVEVGVAEGVADELAPASDPVDVLESVESGKRPMARGTMWSPSGPLSRSYRGTRVNMRRHETHARKTSDRAGVNGLSIELRERN